MSQAAGGSAHILVVDDVQDTLEVLRRNLESASFTVRTATSVSQAVSILEEEPVNLVITDLKMPKVSGIDLVRHVRDNYRGTEVILITGYPTVRTAVEAVKLGAEEYLSKPFSERELLATVRRALEKQASERAPDEVGTEGEEEGLLGGSEPMQTVHRIIRKAARSSATVLITGESGTGKELAARAIHYRSDRSSAAFVPVNCGAIPENLLESELFGYVKGAFTGADQARAGFFQTADQGTIFLDEVSEMSPTMQAKLLRVLQEQEMYMLGSSRPIRLDVRVIASTNTDLKRAMASGTFREDLYYRLNVIAVEMPALRDRGEDVLRLAEHFKRKFAAETGQQPPEFTDRVKATFTQYDWPGNVRELENLVHRLLILNDSGPIDVPDLPAHMKFSLSTSCDPNRSLAEVEAEHIHNVLSSVDGNRTRAAEILGIDRKTLREKLKRIDTEGPTGCR
jgi:DNA-binding NtrC family response regulator